MFNFLSKKVILLSLSFLVIFAFSYSQENIQSPQTPVLETPVLETTEQNQAVPNTDETNQAIPNTNTEEQPTDEVVTENIAPEETIEEEFDEEEEIILDPPKEIKSLIKADLGVPLTSYTVMLLTKFDTTDWFSENVRTPLFWEYRVADKWCAILSIETISTMFFPTGVGILGGASWYPLGKAPQGWYVKALAGGSVGLMSMLDLQVGSGWQIITADNLVISFGADCSFYPIGYCTESFIIPSASISFGWAWE